MAVAETALMAQQTVAATACAAADGASARRGSASAALSARRQAAQLSESRLSASSLRLKASENHWGHRLKPTKRTQLAVPNAWLWPLSMKPAASSEASTESTPVVEAPDDSAAASHTDVQETEKKSEGKATPVDSSAVAANALETAAKPDTEKVAATSSNFRVGYHTEQGLREEMEDDVVIQPDAFGGYLYAAVFDGHVGRSTVEFLKEELYLECVQHLEGGKLLDSPDLAAATLALEKAFEKTDERLLHWLENHIKEPESGSTATAVFARSDRLFVAHLGDSRAVLAQGGDVEDMCEDHRVHGGSDMAIAETKRIKDAGGWVSGGRVCGILAVSRAFGNKTLKTGREQFLQDGIKRGRWTTRFVQKLRFDTAWVSPVPDVYATELKDDAEFIIIASDGLWDAVRSSEAITFVRRKLEEHNDVKRAADELAAFALKQRGSDDNVSVVIVAFK